jgi:hypothetical protein
VRNNLSHRKPRNGFEFGNSVLKFQFQFVLFLAKVIGRFRHDPNGTPSGPSIRFTMLVNGIAAPRAAHRLHHHDSLDVSYSKPREEHK